MANLMSASEDSTRFSRTLLSLRHFPSDAADLIESRFVETPPLWNRERAIWDRSSLRPDHGALLRIPSIHRT